MEKAVQYIKNVQRLISQVLDTQMENIDRAAGIVADTLEKGGKVYAFGTGHSHMMAEELFYRAGGLVKVYPILEESLMLHNGAAKSTELERVEGYAEIILSMLTLSEHDCLIVASNSGRNAVNLEMALGAKQRGMKVIALTNLTHSKAQSSRHKSGLKLYQVADVVLDNQGCLGDASIRIDEINRNVAATSTSLGALLLNSVEVAAIEKMLERGFVPDVFSSSNLDEGDAINLRFFDKYKNEIKPL